MISVVMELDLLCLGAYTLKERFSYLDCCEIWKYKKLILAHYPNKFVMYFLETTFRIEPAPVPVDREKNHAEGFYIQGEIENMR